MKHYFLWLSTGALVACTYYLLSPVLTPFVIAFILAYMFEPLIQSITHKCRAGRGHVVVALFTSLTLLIILGMIWLLPIIYQELRLLFAKTPEYSQYLQGTIVPYVYNKLDSLSPELAGKISATIQDSISSIASIILNQVSSFWNYTLATINFFIISLITLLSLFYFMYHWPVLIKEIMGLVPHRYRNIVHQVLINIDLLISRYFKGQLTVCAIFVLYYTLGLKLIGLNVSVLLGIISGFIIIIPFIGIPCALGLALIVSYHAFGWDSHLIYVAILYGAGYLLDSSLITPKIVGSKIGLHPLWIIFAVITAGGLLGISGVILAIPLAGIVKILLKTGLKIYKSSNLYLK